jgi:hypothetical protein
MMKSSGGCVFIAYDPQDGAEAQALAGHLENAGFGTWLAGRDLTAIAPEQAYAAIRSAASQSASFLLVLSGRPVDLNMLGDLTQIADAAGKPIYPVRMGAEAQVPGFPALARAKAWIDASGPARDQELARLVAELGAVIPRQAAAPVPSFAGASQWAQPAGVAPAPGQQPTHYGSAPSHVGPATGWESVQQSIGFRILMIVLACIMILTGLMRIASAF